MRVCRFLKGQIWRGIRERVLVAAGVPGKLYCAELYLFFALIQPNTKAGLVMTGTGEKFLTAASITVVISIITIQVVRGDEGKPDPGLAPGQGSRGGYAIAAFGQDVCFATHTNTVDNYTDTCSQGLDFASPLYMACWCPDKDSRSRCSGAARNDQEDESEWTRDTRNIGEASVSLLVEGNANRT
mgnify:FL=1